MPGIVCVAISGQVVFDPGAIPPSEATVEVLFAVGDGADDEQLRLKAIAPDYRFDVRVPRGVAPRLRLAGLPDPWLDDLALQLNALIGPRSVRLRSDPGIPVTATFRFPQGTVAPPPFAVSVRRSEGDRWFTPVDVADGQLTFHVRRGAGYAVAASPQGFGNVLAQFPGRSGAHAIVVDVEREALPITQKVTLVEGPDESPAGYQRSYLLPVLLASPGPSGGGPVPYTPVILGLTGRPGVLSHAARIEAGRRQRIALWALSFGNDDVATPASVLSVMFLSKGQVVPGAPSLDVEILDDDRGDRPALLTVADATPGRCCASTANVLRRAEGATGDEWSITLALDKPAPAGGAEVMVDTVSSPDLEFPNPFQFVGAGSVAVEGDDYRALSQRVIFAEGTRSATVRIEGIGNGEWQPERRFYLTFTGYRGLVPRDPAVELRILNDDVDLRPAARHDQLPVTPLSGANVLDVLANDMLPADRFPGGSLQIVELPSLGTAAVDTRGTATLSDDRIVYTPQAGRAGQVDRLRYRLCDLSGETCVSALVGIPIRPVPDASIAWAPSAESGFRDIVFSGLPRLADARVEVLARPLAQGEFRRGIAAAIGGLPSSFETSRATVLDLPSVSVDTVRTFVVHLVGEPGSDLDLHVRYDRDQVAVIDEPDPLCSSASTGSVETCLVRFTQTPGGPRHLNLGVANAGPSDAAYRLIVGGVDGLAPLPGVAATAPTRIEEGEAFPVRLSWRNDAAALHNGVMGLLRLRDADGQSLGDLPFVIDLPREASETGEITTVRPVALRSGETALLHLPPEGQERRRIFVDVPPGTDQLRFAFSRTGNAPRPAGISLRRAPLPSVATDPSPGFAPDPDSNAIHRTLSGGTTDVVIQSPTPARWFVVLHNPAGNSGSNAPVAVTATLTAATAAPEVRPGGYFNPSRSGHGLFVYPAGGEWAGLWYTYTQDGAPVWYYLQGAKPGANGIWSAPIFRSGWNGSRNHLTEVGRATITPTAADAFQFTYLLDGELGTEPFTRFGRGCPNMGGRVVDASGHWFDPVRAGTGYTVQLFPDYEFYLVFAYDARGVPRFLVAERGGVGNANDSVPLQQLRGVCPLCARTGAPARTTVGVLRREFVNGQLSRIAVDAAFTNGTPGNWMVNDAVVPLGGLQGCAAN